MAVLLNRRAVQLDTALAGRVDGLSVQHEVSLVHRLHAVGMVTAPPPTEEFRDALRTRLMAVAAAQGVGGSASAPAPSAVSWRTRLATLGAGVMAGVVAVSGVAVASSRSLPGDPFYGVKRTTEDLQLQLAVGPQDEGIRHLQFAATRLREVRALVLGRDASAAVTSTAAFVDAEEQDGVRDALADMDEQTRTGVRLLTSAFRESRASGPLEQLRRFAARQGDGLRQMLPALGGPALVQAQGSLTLLDGVRAEADELLMLVDCTSACDPTRTAPAPAGGSAPARSPCDCPTRVPVPKTAPAPPPAAPAPAPAPVRSGPSTAPSSPPPPPPSEAPSAPPSQEPAPPADDEPQPFPVPVPTVPVAPPLPPLEPLDAG